MKRKTIALAVILGLLLLAVMLPAAARPRLRMEHRVTCNSYTERYTIRWEITEHFPGTVAYLLSSSRQGRWHGEWDWIHHPYTYDPTLWMSERVAGNVEGVLSLKVRVLWRDAETGRVRDRGGFRDSVRLEGDCGGANPSPSPSPSPSPVCDPAYPTVCIPPPPPDLDCDDITYRNFAVRAPDPHGFDGDNDGVGCET